MLSIRTDEDFRPLIAAIKENNVYATPFLNITERMETLHEKPYRAHRPPENSNRNVDIAWHLARDVDKRPAPPPVGSLYNGFAVKMQPDHNIYLVYNNERHLFPNEAVMRKMGFDLDSVLNFRRSKYHPVTHRIVENMIQGDDVPAEGITWQITPSYILKPLF